MTSPIDFNYDGKIQTTVDLNKPPAPTAGAYGTLFQPIFGTLSQEYQQEIWNYYLYLNTFSDPPPADPKNLENFLGFASGIYKRLQENIIADENFTVNLPLLQPPTTGFYANALQNYFSDVTPAELGQVWAQFLLNNNFTIVAPPENAVTEALFTSYASSVFGLDPQQTYNFSLLDIPTTGFYADAMQSYFGDQKPLEQKKLWVRFLLNHGFTNSAPPDDAATRQLFISFASVVLDSIYDQNVHSPQEIRKRYIMGEAITSLQKMLNNLQDTIAVQSRNLIFYGTWQQEYTKMMARVPTYVGDPDNAVKIPTPVDIDNLDRFTFGYDKLSVSDIAEWWAANSLAGDGSPFVMESYGKDFFGDSLMKISYNPQPNATTGGSITWTGGSITIPPQPTIDTFDSNGAQSQRQLAQEAYAKAFKTAFVSAWTTGNLQAILNNVNGQNLAQINAIDANTPRPPTGVQPRTKPDASAFSVMEIPWGYSYVVASQFHSNPDGNTSVPGKLSDDNARARGEINAKLQNFIENIRGRRKSVQGDARKLQADLDQSRQTVTKQSDILNSILKSINELVKSIFRR